jgi:hypothetical protein
MLETELGVCWCLYEASLFVFVPRQRRILASIWKLWTKERRPLFAHFSPCTPFHIQIIIAMP